MSRRPSLPPSKKTTIPHKDLIRCMFRLGYWGFLNPGESAILIELVKMRKEVIKLKREVRKLSEQSHGG